MIIVRFLAALIVIAGLIWSLAFSQSATARYQYYENWFSPTFLNEDPVDVVIIGRSGLQTAINADKFSAELEAVSGNPQKVIDLSKSWSGADTQLVQARDILDNADVETLVVQMYPDVAREHEMFFELATYSDIFRGSFAYADMNAVEKLQRALSLSLRKWSSSLSKLVAGEFEARRSLPPTRGSADPTPAPDAQNDQAQSDWAAAVGADWQTKPSDVWDITANYDARNRFFYQEIVDLAEERDVRLVFLFLPELYNAPMNPDFVTKLRDRYGAIDILAPTVDDIINIYPDAYADHGHANEQGQDYFNRMYAQQLDALLKGVAPSFYTVDGLADGGQSATEALIERAAEDLPNVIDGIDLSPVADGLIRDGDLTLIVQGRADYGLNAELLIVRFYDSAALIQVYNDISPRRAETYELVQPIEQVGGTVAAQVRAIFSRECSAAGEDFGQIIETLDAERARTTLRVSHQFIYDHNCAKLVFQVLNASPSIPITLRFDRNVASIQEG
ncbi:hypothetical protein AB6B39_00890 [Algimonas porphyrae]|uniref:hypothetical protein n=1 Tax=Algimonas porphyrae TaxID=1128113 RepID=UPI00352AC2C1